MDIQTPQDTDKIRALNDNFRRTFIGGVVVTTSAIAALSDNVKAEVLLAVKTFNRFTEDNNPHGENDMAFFDVEGLHCFFKLDYFDRSMEMGSPNPADPSVTKRCLTIGLASDY